MRFKVHSAIDEQKIDEGIAGWDGDGGHEGIHPVTGPGGDETACCDQVRYRNRIPARFRVLARSYKHG